MSDLTDPYPVEPFERPIDATVTVPGSKSITNRALVCAALAEGDSTLTGALVADDTLAMIGCLTQLGASIDLDEGVATVRVTGCGGQLRPGPVELDARLSGTTARFLLPVLAIGPGPYRIDGLPPLRSRPMGPGIGGVRALGVELVEQGEPAHLPVVVSGRASGTEIAVPGSVSSQFVSGLLLAAPCFGRRLSIRVEGELVSRPYVELTRAVMQAFGAEVADVNGGPDEQRTGYSVAPDGYAPATFAVEPDASTASYLLAAAAIRGGRVRVVGLGSATRQGDLAFVDLLERMGATVEVGTDFTEVRGTGDLRGIDVDLVEMPDMAQTLAAVAVFATGPTRVRGIGVVRGHETDRIAAVVTELQRCGVGATETEDGFVVQPGSVRPAVVQTYDDHRMAMAFALLGLRAPGIEIADPGCVSKTFPGFWSALEGLRAGVA